MEQEAKQEVDYDSGVVWVDEDNGNVMADETAIITLPNGYWIEQDIDGDFENIYSEDGGGIDGETRDKMLHRYESYIDDCINAMAEEYITIIKSSKYYADKEIITIDKEFYNTNRGNYEVLHCLTRNLLVVTYSDYHENFFRKMR